MDEEQYIFDLVFDELASLMQTWGEANYRAKQVWEGLYRHLWAAPDIIQMDGTWSNLAKGLRKKLSEWLSFNRLDAQDSLESKDGDTRKTLFALPDGAAIETVLMRYHPHHEDVQRYTLCISSQAGCAMGCKFCATGQMGFMRNLTAGEMVEQVIFFARLLKERGEVLTNVVVMGMGEPFLNYENTMKAIDILNDAQGFNMGQRRFTVSTVGILPQMEKFTTQKRQVNLAVSLHAADDELRSRLLPVNKKYPLGKLLETCRKYVETSGRRITFEWALIEDVNDTARQAHLLASLLAGMLCHVNLIPLNPTDRYAMRGTALGRAKQFQAILESHGIACTLRLRRGIDIQAGCGQLMARKLADSVEFPGLSR